MVEKRERRGKEILEEICEELAKGIGEDRAEVEELKKESAKVREEVEKEREMLQLADVLREERVQMKLCEAKYEFEEKNAAIQSLKHHLESYFITQLHQNPQTQTLHHFSSNKFDKIKQLEAYLKKINFGSSQNQTKQTHNIQEQDDGNKISSDDDDDEEEEEGDQESDLHSIELNMDNHNNSYRWSFVHGSQQRNSFEKDQKLQWESICLNSKPTTKNGDAFDCDRFTDLFAQSTHKLQHPDKDQGGGNKSMNCLGSDILFSGEAEITTPTPTDQNGIETNVQIVEN